MVKFFKTFKKRWISRFINFGISKLAKTKNEKDFYETLDRMIVKLMPFVGENKKTLKDVRKAFQIRHPITQIARALLQRRLSETARKKLVNDFLLSWLTRANRRDRLEEEGFKTPWFFVISPTYACNLNCYGCYAHEYRKGKGLSFGAFDRILREAKDLGVRFVTVSGGEPFFWQAEDGKNLFDIARIHKDIFFQIYTNATLLDKEAIKRLAELGNIVPAISQEGMEKETDERRGKGTWAKICKARELLYKAGVLQGFSVTTTSKNAEVVTSDKFIDDLITREISFGWYFIYIPVGKEPSIELMPTPEQRIHLRNKIWKWRSTKPIFVGDFWNDGPWVGGCIAGGRKYFHINALGDIEPCVFCHFAVDNIHRLWKEEKGLKEAILSPFFLDFRKKQLEVDNWCAPCCVIDNPKILREVVQKHKAYPTHKGAEAIIQGEISRWLDIYSTQIRKKTQEDFEGMKRGDYDTPTLRLSKTIRDYLKMNKREVELIKKRK